MDHIDGEKLWKAYKDAICKEMGTRETSDDELGEMAKACLGDFFTGIYARGEEQPRNRKKDFIIVNTSAGPPGEHWIGIYREAGHPDLVYDTFGRGTMNFPGRATDEDAEQKKSEDWCGQGCIAFGLVAKMLGQGAQVV